MKKSIVKIVNSETVRMGDVRIGQPIPQTILDEVNPFILLHHAGPKEISAYQPGFYVPPHPHRGFEPVTFVFQGEVEHKDSLGNESVVKAGGVQWITAGAGIIHSEGNPKPFIDKGGQMEIIQLWINLPSHLKMSPPQYQAFDADDIPAVELQNGTANLIAGKQNGMKGPISSPTQITAITVEMENAGNGTIQLPEGHNGLIYVLNGEGTINGEPFTSKQLAQLTATGSKVIISTTSPTKMLVLAGEPIHEPKSMWGPYVMNTQTEIMEALRDFEMGKMGFLAG